MSYSLEVDGNGHMELELINSVSTVFNNIVFERAGTFVVKLVLICNRVMSWMDDTVFRFDTGLAIEYFCLTVQLVNHIAQIMLIEEHFPIKRMQVRRTFTKFGEVLVPNTEEIELTLFD